MVDRWALLSTIANCYRQHGVAADQLPYTDDLEALYQEVLRQSRTTMTRAEFRRLLTDARKCGALPRLTR